METFATILLLIGMINCAYVCTRLVSKKKSLYKRGWLFFGIVFTTSVFISGYGGGITRDLVLGRRLAFLTASDCWLSTVVGCILGILGDRKKDFVERSLLHKFAVSYTDDLGSIGFLFIGSSIASGMNYGVFLCFLSGFLTAFGGGIIASLLNIPERKSGSQIMHQLLWSVIKAGMYFYVILNVRSIQHMIHIIGGLLLRLLISMFFEYYSLAPVATYRYHPNRHEYTEIRNGHVFSLKHIRFARIARMASYILRFSYHRRCSNI